jgi:hypothetical protein
MEVVEGSTHSRPHLASREAEVDMKHLFSRHTVQFLATVSLTTLILPTLEAESHCPGGAAGVTPRLVQHALIVIPVRLNQAGPFDFMVDTGSQVTVIDPSLASELNLRSQGTVGLVSVASSAQASVTVLDTLEADSRRRKHACRGPEPPPDSSRRSTNSRSPGGELSLTLRPAPRLFA